MKKQFRLTEDGVEELKQELSGLIAQRTSIAERLKTAREYGDLSENAEYSSARQEQERNETRISEIEHILQNVDIIKSAKIDGKVRLGSKVKLRHPNGQIRLFQVVGTVEADPTNGKISDESPIGQALLNKSEGEKVSITTPTETVEYKVVGIS